MNDEKYVNEAIKNGYYKFWSLEAFNHSSIKNPSNEVFKPYLTNKYFYKVIKYLKTDFPFMYNGTSSFPDIECLKNIKNFNLPCNTINEDITTLNFKDHKPFFYYGENVLNYKSQLPEGYTSIITGNKNTTNYDEEISFNKTIKFILDFKSIIFLITLTSLIFIIISFLNFIGFYINQRWNKVPVNVTFNLIN